MAADRRRRPADTGVLAVTRLDGTLIAVLSVVTLVLAACGGGGEEPEVAADGGQAAGTTSAQEDDAGGGDTGEAGEIQAPDGFPTGDITMLIPYDAGGGGDAYSRAVADAMGELLPVNVVPENRPPAAEALSMLWNVEPDGYTIGYMPMPATVGIALEQPEAAPWETTEFEMLGIVESNGYVVYVAGDSEYHTLEDLQNASGLTTMNTDPGSGSALASGAAIVGLGLDANQIFGADTTAEISTALIRGDIDFTVHGVSDYPGMVESGEVRPLFFLGTDEQRIEEFDWVQTLPDWEDVGRPEFEGAVSEYRVFATPPGISQDRLEYLRQVFWEAVNSDMMREWSEDAGRPLLLQDAEEAEEIVQNQVAAMEELVPQIGQSAQE